MDTNDNLPSGWVTPRDMVDLVSKRVNCSKDEARRLVMSALANGALKARAATMSMADNGKVTSHSNWAVFDWCWRTVGGDPRCPIWRTATATFPVQKEGGGVYPGASLTVFGVEISTRGLKVVAPVSQSEPRPVASSTPTRAPVGNDMALPIDPDVGAGHASNKIPPKADAKFRGREIAMVTQAILEMSSDERAKLKNSDVRVLLERAFKKTGNSSPMGETLEREGGQILTGLRQSGLHS